MLSTPAIVEVVLWLEALWQRDRTRIPSLQGRPRKFKNSSGLTLFFFDKHLKLYYFLIVIARLKNEQIVFGFWASESL